MERFVLFLCGCWMWLTRKRRTARYREVAISMHSAALYLRNDFASRASAKDRGFLMPYQVDALSILQRHSKQAFQTARKFDSLLGCYRLMKQELLGALQVADAAPKTVRASQTPVATKSARAATRFATAAPRRLEFEFPAPAPVAGHSSVRQAA